MCVFFGRVSFKEAKITPKKILYSGALLTILIKQICAFLEIKYCKLEIRKINTCQASLEVSVCNLNTKEHKSKSAAITQIVNRVQNLAGF